MSTLESSPERYFGPFARFAARTETSVNCNAGGELPGRKRRELTDEWTGPKGRSTLAREKARIPTYA